MKKIIYIFAAVILLQIFFNTEYKAQNKNLTLKESIEIGLINNKDIKFAKSKYESSSAKLTETTSALLPQFKLSGSYTRLSEVPEFGINFMGNSITINNVILNNYSLRASLQQPIFTGFKLSSLRNASKLNRNADGIEYNQSINEVAFKIHYSFWQLYKVQRLLELIDENLKASSQHLTDTKNFLKNGLATQNDYLKLQVQNSNIELQKIEAETNLQSARMQFNQIIGYPVNFDTEIETSEIILEQSEFEFEEIKTEALKNRSELIAMQNRVAASGEFVKAAKGNWSPQIFLGANYNYAKPNQRYFPLEDKFNDTWDVSLNFSWDIWNWGGTSAKIEQAKQNKIQSELNLSNLKEIIEIEVYRNYRKLESSLQKIQVTKNTLAQAQENYRITNDKYKMQLSTSTDLIDAKNSLLQAKINYTNSIVDYEIAKVQLEKSIGRKIY